MDCTLYEERKQRLLSAGFRVEEVGYYSASVSPVNGGFPIPVVWLYYSDGSAFYPSLGRNFRNIQKQIRHIIPRSSLDLGVISTDAV